MRKETDRSHFVNKNEHHRGTNYFTREELLEKFEYNQICSYPLVENDHGVIRDNFMLIVIQDCLEDRMKELVSNSVFRILMKTGKPEFSVDED